MARQSLKARFKINWKHRYKRLAAEGWSQTAVTMRVLMGVIKDRHGTYYARKTVPAKPKELGVAVAAELNNGKPAQSHLKKFLGTKDVREANVRAKPVPAEFDRLIAKAKARIAANDAPAKPGASGPDLVCQKIHLYLGASFFAKCILAATASRSRPE